MLAVMLEGEGYRVTSARDGHEGLDAVHHDRPGLIILDWEMPGMSGEEFLKYFAVPHLCSC